MSNSESDHSIPLLEKSRARQPLSHTFSRTWVTIMVMSTQILCCGLVWGFAGAMIVKKVIPLPDNLARWVYHNPSETNMSVTVISTVLAMTVSALLGISVQLALTFRLSRGVRLSMATAWIQLARKSLFLHYRSHPWWTLLSVLWVAIIGFLTSAWSSLLTPTTVVRYFPRTGQEVDFLSPDVSNFIYTVGQMLPADSTYGNWSLVPGVVNPGIPGQTSQAGVSAAMAASNATSFAFVNYAPSIQFNSSTGGIYPYITSLLPLSDGLDENYRGLSVTNSFTQQGYTASVSCMVSSSPTITLNNTGSVQKTTELSTGSTTYATQTWSWTGICSENTEYYTGEVDIWATSDLSDATPIGNGLFATSVCFYQNFSGLSNQSFLVVMKSPYNSTYNVYYPIGDPDLPTICEVTPMVTTVEVQYNDSGIINVSNIQDQVQLPNDFWPILVDTGSYIWTTYFVAQGPYSNSMADDILLVWDVQKSTSSGDPMPILEQYLRGIIEYSGSNWREYITNNLTYLGQPLPENMTTQFNGTTNVKTMGWTFHPRTHGVALAVITLVTIVTTASGILALIEANRQRQDRDAAHLGTAAFDPTNLVDVLVASSVGNLSTALSDREGKEDRENLRVQLGVTDKGKSVLNTGVADPASARSKYEVEEDRESLKVEPAVTDEDLY